jgi:hypothetical protein
MFEMATFGLWILFGVLGFMVLVFGLMHIIDWAIEKWREPKEEPDLRDHIAGVLLTTGEYQGNHWSIKTRGNCFEVNDDTESFLVSDIDRAITFYLKLDEPTDDP